MNLLGIATLLFISCLVGVVKCASTIIEIEKAKDFKKALATKTNLLVLYTSNPKSSEVVTTKNLLKSVDGSFAFVDCTVKDLKKLCKKVLMDDNVYVLRHFKDGVFNKDYDRQMTKQSLQNFMRDPTGDIPYEEDSTAKDVIHLLETNHLEKLMRKEKHFLAMFYTNWCGFCKKIKPLYSTVASETKNQHVLAAMDMEKSDSVQIRKKFNITGFPTLLYFENGQPKYTFEGEHTKEGLVDFLNNPSQPPEPKQKEVEWAADPNSEIVHLTAKNFDLILQEEKTAIVMFHTSWCGHCKNLKPKYEAAAVKLKNKNIPGLLAAVDSTKEAELASKFGVKGYPTLKLFENGEFKFDVKLRETDAIVKFMENPDEPPIEEKEVSWEEEENDIVFLNEETFKTFLKKKKSVLVLFYAPWCFHCKAAKPELIKAAEEFKDDPRIEFCAVDCTKHSSICSAYEVRGYPTIKYFSYLKFHKDYKGERKSTDFIKFMRNPDQEVEKPKDEVIPFTSEKVILLNDKNFDATLKQEKSLIIVFFTNWCGHCKALKPVYSNAADLIFEKGISGVLAAVDCGSFYELCKKHNIEGYPTLKYFKNGKYLKNYTNERTADALIRFLQSHAEKEEL